MTSKEQTKEAVAAVKYKVAGMLESDDADGKNMTQSDDEAKVVSNEQHGPFSKKTWVEDLTLEVEGKNLYVSKGALATVCPGFRKMFEGNVATERIVLRGKKYEDVVEFLLCIYPNPETLKKIDVNNVMTVVPFIVEYQVVNLLSTCEACIGVILDGLDSIEDLLFYLKIAAAHGIEKTKRKCLTLLTKTDVQKIERSKTFGELPQELKMDVFSFVANSLNGQVKKQKKTIDLQNKVIANDEQFKEYYLAGFRSSQRAQMALYKTSGSIHFKFAPVSWNSKTLTSKPVIFGESVLQLEIWKITSHPSMNGSSFHLHRFANDESQMKAGLVISRNRGSLCVKYELVNTFSNKDNIVKCVDHCTPEKSNISFIIDWDVLIDESKGFIRDGIVELNAYFILAQ